VDPVNTQKPPVYISGVTLVTISPLIQLLEQTVEKQYELKALQNNQVKIFHTYKPKEERNYKVVLKNMYYSINPEDIKAESEKLGHSVTNIWNIKQYRTKLPLSMFFVELQPAPNIKDIFNVEYIQ
jgi:hypothetical protein